jgi:hypothetical protein
VLGGCDEVDARTLHSSFRRPSPAFSIQSLHYAPAAADYGGSLRRGRERILTAVPEGHGLAGREPVYWIDLRKETILLSRWDPELADPLVARATSPGHPGDALNASAENVWRSADDDLRASRRSAAPERRTDRIGLQSLTAYLWLLGAADEGADRREVVQIIVGLDSADQPQRGSSTAAISREPDR